MEVYWKKLMIHQAWLLKAGFRGMWCSRMTNSCGWMVFCFTFCSMINKMPTKSNNFEVELHDEAKHPLLHQWPLDDYKKWYTYQDDTYKPKIQTCTCKLHYLVVGSKLKLVKLIFSNHSYSNSQNINRQ